MDRIFKIAVISSAVGVIVLANGCRDDSVRNIKDLSDNMRDIQIYQENLGDHIRDADMDVAGWLADGLDSLLGVVGKKFQEHRKLSEPFSRSYKTYLERPMKGIRAGIRSNDTASALKSYRLLVRKCNSCHLDNDIDEEVWY